jgi:hypothetical protein
MCFDKTSSELQFKSKKASKQQKDMGKSGVYCKFCHAQISHPSLAIEVQGAFQHMFKNPEGITFLIGLYQSAECLATGPVVYEHTWFSGYAWQTVICHHCKSLIGWSYSQSDSPDFYGLILNRLSIVDK